MIMPQPTVRIIIAAARVRWHCCYCGRRVSDDVVSDRGAYCRCCKRRVRYTVQTET